MPTVSGSYLGPPRGPNEVRLHGYHFEACILWEGHAIPSRVSVLKELRSPLHA